MMAFPKLRFKNAEGAEFTSWVTSFIGDECKITTGNKDTQNKIDGGKYPFFVRSQTVERINTYSKDCEAILTSGDGVGVGKNYHYINGKFDFHQRVYCLYDFSNQLLGKYLYIYFSNYFFDRVKRLSAKNSVDSVRMDMISKMEIKLPSLVEQTKIASFLSAVDEKISQLTQKQQLLSQYKQGMMQKLFSQQIRFKADDGSEFGEWEGKELHQIFQIKAGGDIEKSSVSEVRTSEFSYPIFANSDKNKGFYGWANKFKYKEAVTVTGRGNLGIAVARNEPFYPIVRLLVLLPLVKQNLKFFEEQINLLDIVSESTGVPQLTAPQLSKYKVNVPSLEEQTKIANFLSSIDQKIEVVAQQIEQAKQWKKGLLQQMFI